MKWEANEDGIWDYESLLASPIQLYIPLQGSISYNLGATREAFLKQEVALELVVFLDIHGS